jgi:hypothetical protein
MTRYLMTGAARVQQWPLGAATLRRMRTAWVKMTSVGRREWRRDFACNRFELPFAVRQARHLRE